MTIRDLIMKKDYESVEIRLRGSRNDMEGYLFSDKCRSQDGNLISGDGSVCYGGWPVADWKEHDEGRRLSVLI